MAEVEQGKVMTYCPMEVWDGSVSDRAGALVFMQNQARDWFHRANGRLTSGPNIMLSPFTGEPEESSEYLGYYMFLWSGERDA